MKLKHAIVTVMGTALIIAPAAMPATALAAQADATPVALDYQLYPNTSHIHPHMCG